MLLLILSLLLLTYQVSGAKVCRTRDYTAVLGSSDLTITEIVASVTPDGEYLVIGGTASFNGRRRVLEANSSDNELLEFDINEYIDDNEEQTKGSHSTRRDLSITPGTAFGFFYSFSLQTCEVGVFTGYAVLSGGIKAVYADTQTSYIYVGYDSSGKEFVIMPEGNVSTIRSFSNTDTVLTSGLGWHNTILIVAGESQLKLIEFNSSKTLQLSFNDDISIVHQITSDSQILVTLNIPSGDQNLIGIFRATCSYDSGTGTLSPAYTLNEIDHGFTTSFVARLDALGDNTYMCFHQVAGAGSVFFDLQDTTGLNSYEEQTWAQCIAVDATTYKYLMLTTSNKYQVIQIFSTGQYTKTDAFSAIPGVSAFDSSLTGLKAHFKDGIATVYGLTNTIASTSIGYNVGFVMTIVNNINYRKNNFFKSAASETGSYTDLGVAMDPNVVDSPDEADLDPDVGSTQVEAIHLADILNLKLQWTYKMDECKPQTFVQETYFGFQDISIDLVEDLGGSTQNLSQFDFDPGEVFDASYINDNSIRSSCFPAYQNTYSTVPIGSDNEYMLNYDSNRLIWEWNPRATMDEGIVDIQVIEYTTAVGDTPFHKLDIRYKLDYSYLTFKMLVSGMSRTFELASKEQGLTPGNTEVSWECYSDYCPDFIKVNSWNLTISVDGTFTTGKQAAGTYMLSIRSKDVVQNILILESFFIIIRHTRTGFRTSQEWNRWVASEHTSQSVGRQPESQNGRRSRPELNAFSDQITEEVDEIQEISTWTDEQLEEAYAESLERYNADEVDYHTAISMTNQGLITVNFFPDLMIPSYILRRAQEYIDSSHTQDETEEPDDSTDALQGDSERRRRLNEERLFRFLQAESWDGDDSFGFKDDYFDGDNFDSNDFVQDLQDKSDKFSFGGEDDGTYGEDDGTQGENFDDFEDQDDNDNNYGEYGDFEDQDNYDDYNDYDNNNDYNNYNEYGDYGDYGYYDEEDDNYYGECRRLSVRKRKKKGKRNKDKQSARHLPCIPEEVLIYEEDCYFNQVLNYDENKCDELEIYFGHLEDLYSMRIESSVENEDGNMDEIGYSFKLVSISQQQVQFQFNFDDPYAISITNKLILELNFETFDEKGTYKKTTVPMRKQIPEVQNLITMAQATSGCATASVACAAIVQIVMNGALAQIWGMINGLQLVMHLPTLNLSFPEVTFTVIEKLLGVFTFDIPNVAYTSFPDGLQPHYARSIFTDVKDDSADQLVVNLNSLEYGSAYLTDMLGSFYIIFLVVMICLILILLVTPLEFLTTIRKARMWLKKNLLWNFILRMFLESAIVNTYCFMLTLQYGEWIQFGGIVNMSSAWILASISFLLPFFILIFYFKNYDRMNSEDEEVAEEFDEKWGAPMEGLNKDNKWSLAYPVMFLTRRILFVLIVLWLYTNVILQLALQISITLISYAYLTHFKPFEDRIVQELEVFNEVMLLIMIDVLVCFTDIIQNEEDKQELGYAFIFLLIINIGVHVFFLVKTTIEGMKRGYREKSYRLASRNVRTHSTFVNSNKTWRCCYVTFWCKCLNKYQGCVKLDLFWLWLGYRGKYEASETTIREEDEFDNEELTSIRDREEVKRDGDTEKTAILNIHDYNSKEEETKIIETQRQLMGKVDTLRQQTNISPIKPQNKLYAAQELEIKQIEPRAGRQKSNVELELDPIAVDVIKLQNDFSIQPLEEVDVSPEQQVKKTLSMYNIGFDGPNE